MGDEPIWVVFLPTPVIQAGSSVGDGGVDAGCEVEVFGWFGQVERGDDGLSLVRA